MRHRHGHEACARGMGMGMRHVHEACACGMGRLEHWSIMRVAVQGHRNAMRGEGPEEGCGRLITGCLGARQGTMGSRGQGTMGFRGGNVALGACWTGAQRKSQRDLLHQLSTPWVRQSVAPLCGTSPAPQPPGDRRFRRTLLPHLGEHDGSMHGAHANATRHHNAYHSSTHILAATRSDTVRHDRIECRQGPGSVPSLPPRSCST